MSNNEAADKLRERVQDWQSYLGKAENPWSHSVSAEPTARPNEGAANSPAGEERRDEQADRQGPAVEFSRPSDTPVIEVVPSAVEEEVILSGASPTVIEVLPPEPATRPYDLGPKKSRNGRRALDEAELKGVLFSDTRHAESEFQHVRRTNAILSVVAIILLGVISTIIAWFAVD